MYELFYTSLDRGLVPGTSGYTTVGHTSEMSRTLVELAEKLSSYSFLSGDPTAYAGEPVNWSHLRVGAGGQGVHVVSRIAACAPDHTGRSNYLAHHALLSSQEAAACKAGPAALAAAPGFLTTRWEGQARLFPARSTPAIMDRGPTTSVLEAAGVDAGWGGALADRLRDRNVKQTFLIYAPGTNIIGIVGDVFSELSPEERWQATFATHATKSFPGLGVECRLRCVVAGTPYAQEVAKLYPADTFDLARLPPPPARTPRPRAAAPMPRPAMAAKAALPPLPASRGARVESFADEPEQPFDLAALPSYPIPQPSMAAGSQSGLGGILFWVPTVLSLLMTIGCGLLGYQWSQATSEVANLQQKNESLRDKQDELKEQLAEKEQSLAGLKKELQAARQATAAQGGPKPEPASQRPPVKPDPDAQAASQDKGKDTGTEPPGDKPAPQQMAAGGAGVAKTPTDIPASAGQQDRDDNAPPRPKAGGRVPQLPADVRVRLDQVLEKVESLKKEKDLEITLIKDLDAAPEDIEFDNKKVSDLLNAKIERKGGGWSFTATSKNKTVGGVKYDPGDHSLVLDVKNPPLWYLTRFLALRVTVKGVDKPVVIPLGSPLRAELRMKTDESRKPVNGSPVFPLFSDDAANKLLGRVLEEFKDQKIHESIEFGPGDGFESFAPESKNLPAAMQKPSMPEHSFVLSRRGGSPRIGVVVKRVEPRTPEYAVHSYVVEPLQYGALAKDSEFKGPWGCKTEGLSDLWFFTVPYMAKITALFHDDLELAKDAAKFPKGNEMLTKAKTADVAAFEEAKKLFAETLLKKSFPVRFELKVPGSDVGLVIADSLAAPGGGK